MVATTAKCLDATLGWEEVTSLVTWRGTNLGCYHDTTVSAASCSTDNANGSPVDVRDATDL